MGTVKNDWEQIVTNSKEISEIKGITQQEIAEKTGLEQSNISRVFSLKYSPTLKILAIIAYAVGCEINIKNKAIRTN